MSDRNPASLPQGLPEIDTASQGAGGDASRTRFQAQALQNMGDITKGAFAGGSQLMRERARGGGSAHTPDLVIAMADDKSSKKTPDKAADSRTAKGDDKERKSGSFDLKIGPSSKTPDSNGRIPVDKFDQIPVRSVAVHEDGKISLGLHQETTVRQPNDPAKPNLRNQELRFGKKAGDGSISCSAEVKTKTAADGTINHITLDNPANLNVAGEEWIGKKVFGANVGTWVSGESPVKKAVFDATGPQPKVSVTFDHPLNGATTTTQTIPKEDFTQMVAWVEGARTRALAPTSKIAGVSPRHNGF